MPLYEVNQNINNNSAKQFSKIDTDAITLNGLIALMPNGQTVYAPTATGATGVLTAVPSQYSTALISCFDKTDRIYATSFVGLKYGKFNLTDDEIVTACLTNVETPNGTSCDQVNVNKYQRVGA